MTRRSLIVVAVVALVAAGCAQRPQAELQFGSGVRFVPMVADPLNDAGVDPSVVVTSDGSPAIAYFAFEEQLEEGQLPQTRPVGAPSLPGVMLSTVSPEGVWTRGAIAIQGQIPNVDVPFNPAFDDSVADLKPGNVTGLQVVADGDTFHAAWGSVDGVFYATGSLDPNAQQQVEIAKVTDTPGAGLSIGLDDGGTPWIAYYTSVGPQASAEVATVDGGSWRTEDVSTASIPNCQTCRTAVFPTDGGVGIAFAAGNRIWLATPTDSGWASSAVAGSSGGQGLAAVATPDGVALTYYDDGGVTLATGSPGRLQTHAVADVERAVAGSPGARTSVAVADDGTAYVAWQDADGVRFASGQAPDLAPIETAPDTLGGQMPAVAVSPDGSRAFLAWYETDTQDLLAGVYGDVTGLAVAGVSPTPTGSEPQPSPEPQPQNCAQVTGGVVTIVAAGLAFDAPCIDAPAGQPFTITLDNKDQGVQHNISVFQSEQDLANPIFQGDLITGPDTIDYRIPALDPGQYYFHCDVHPNMNGSLNVGQGAGATGATGATGGTGGAGGGGGGGAATVSVVALNIAFDTDRIELPAGEATTIDFSNEDAGVQHNIAIFPSEQDLANPLFRGDLITGPDEIVYDVPPLDAGEYYFHCDVHANMAGTVVVS